MNPGIRLREFADAKRRGDDFLCIHYACENLYEVKDRPAAISCICFRTLDGSSYQVFSVVDAARGVEPEQAETQVLENYFRYLQHHSDARIVHWNMNSSDYGFSALEARYRYLTSNEPSHRVAESATFDLDDLIAYSYGAAYVDHPKLRNLAVLNGFGIRHALSGREEAEKFANGDHGGIKRSTAEKVQWIGKLASLLVDGKLKRATLRAVLTLLARGWTRFGHWGTSVDAFYT